MYQSIKLQRQLTDDQMENDTHGETDEKSTPDETPAFELNWVTQNFMQKNQMYNSLRMWQA